ncbi:MAG TPA: BTAD domain-containing putative transcriptional regulator [Gemmatimonadales bacterium]|nr:BTAD domain-containing putative transcriptional regulator [Gemmatimonadales bacterium]
MGGAAAQRRSLAVLGLLGASSDRGMSRDKIQAYLWPEVELDKAAHRLAQILYALRRELGVADLFLGSCDLRLNPARIACDVREFETFRQAGDLERAVELYAGPFLDGFFLTDAPEFEHWVENERTGIAQQLFEALETLAAQAVARGDHRLAASWWQRLADHDPLSSRVTVHLMSALAAAGSRAEALERARGYQLLLERELEAAPNPAVVALAEQLRRTPAASPPGLSASVPVSVSIGVLPLAQLTPLSGHDHFVEGLTEELRSTLARIPGVKVAARFSVHALRDAGLDAGEIARRLRLHSVLEGSVRQAGPRVRVNVRLISAADGCHLWSARYERTVADMFAAQDELTGVIVAELRDLLPTLRRVGPSPASNPDA